MTKKIIISTLLLTFSFITGFSQRITDDEKRLAVGLKFGTNSLPMGFDLVYQLKSKMALRLGYSPFKDSKFEANSNMGDKPVYFIGKTHLQNWSALVEIGGWFHVNAGVTGLMSKNLISTDIFIKTNNATGSMVVGTSGGVKPTAGIGFGRSMPRGRVGFGIDFNAIYLKDGFLLNSYDGTEPFKFHMPQAKVEADLLATSDKLKNLIPAISFRTTVRIK